MVDYKTLSKSSNAKLELLINGLRIDSKTMLNIGNKYKEYQYGYNDSNWNNAKSKLEVIPSELLLPGDIVVAPHIRFSSPYLLVKIDGELLIIDEKKEEILSNVSFLKRPNLWTKSLKNGKSCKKIANIYGKNCLNIFITAKCDYWNNGMPCKFCSLKPTQNFHNDVDIEKKITDIKETVEIAFNSGDELLWMVITGGSFKDRDYESNLYIDILNGIKEKIPKEWNGKIKGNSALLPKNDENTLHRLFETGIEHPSFNLEVWGKKLFKNICPGKEKYIGFENILEVYKKSSKIWDYGDVWCNFVGGLTPLVEIKEGF